jgi:hypothetical protein
MLAFCAHALRNSGCAASPLLSSDGKYGELAQYYTLHSTGVSSVSRYNNTEISAQFQILCYHVMSGEKQENIVHVTEDVGECWRAMSTLFTSMKLPKTIDDCGSVAWSHDGREPYWPGINSVLKTVVTHLCDFFHVCENVKLEVSLRCCRIHREPFGTLALKG